MADEDTEFQEDEVVEGEGEEAPPKSKKLLFIILAVVLLGGAGGAWFFFKGGAADKGHVEVPQAPPIYVNLDPPFVVNFEADELVRFLQITISVMTRDLHTEEVLKKNDPRIRNDLLMLLGNQKYASISTREGKEKLQVASLEAVRAVVKINGGEGEKVEALYFTAFVMQ